LAIKLEEYMKFFIDTANLDEIREASEMELIDGVTTNPSLVAKEKHVDFKKHIAKICEVVSGDVSAEVYFPRCLVPECDGVKCTTQIIKETLWDKFYMAAPPRQRHFAEQYKIVKRA
jgi:hypothetical protein